MLMLPHAQTVSIHAPCGRRRQKRHPYLLGRGFNPRPHAGATPRPHRRRRLHLGFNPRSRVWSDGVRTCDLRGLHCFNPRPRVGGDVRAKRQIGDTQVVSIHAPCVGRLFSAAGLAAQSLFQSTPPRGGRRTVPTPGPVVATSSSHRGTGFQAEEELCQVDYL
jgi:hypothetical protein